MLRVRMIPGELAIGGLYRVQIGLYQHMRDVEWVQERAKVITVHAAASNHRIDVYHNHGVWPLHMRHPTAERENAIITRNAKRAKYTIVPSEKTRDLMYRLCSVKALVIPNGIDYASLDKVSGDWFQRHPEINLPQRPTILWLRNRVDMVCNPVHFQKLASELPYNFISTVPAEPALNVGLQHYPEALSLLASCDVMVNTVEDSFGYVTLEAMALGIPVLGLRRGAFPELVDHLETGFVAENSGQLAEGLEWCIQRGRQVPTRKNCYAWETVCATIREVYAECA